MSKMRVLYRQVTEISEDPNASFEIEMDLDPLPFVPCPDFELPLTESGFYPALLGIPAYSGEPPNFGVPNPISADVIFYASGSTPTYPRPADHSGDNWTFPTFGVIDGSLPAGEGDTAWSNVNSVADIYVVGFGTVTVHTGDSFGASPGTYDLSLHHGDPISGYDVSEDLGNFAAGVATDVVIPEDGHCIHMVRYNPRGTSNVEWTVFGGITWAGTYA